MLQPGKYRGIPKEAVLGLTSKGTEQLAITFELIDPPGETVTAYLYFTDKTWERSLESLRYCGWTGTDLEVFKQGNPLPAEMDHEVELVVEHEEYNNATRARVRWINHPGGAAVKNPMDPAAAKLFSERMRAFILDYDQRNPRRSGAAPVGENELDF